MKHWFVRANQSLLHGQCLHTPVRMVNSEISQTAAVDWVIGRYSGTAPDCECGSSPQFELAVRVRAERFRHRCPSRSIVIGRPADCARSPVPEFLRRMIFGAWCVLQGANTNCCRRLVLTHTLG